MEGPTSECTADGNTSIVQNSGSADRNAAVTQRRWNLRVRLETCVASLQSADAATFGLEEDNRVLDLLNKTEPHDVGDQRWCVHQDPNRIALRLADKSSI